MSYGEINGHVVGIVMKELVRRAIEAIRAQRFVFEATEKLTPGKEKDFVTTADKAAQAIYVKVLREAFPQFGIVAEEDDLRVECTHPSMKVYFSIDPLDGTKAFMRRQSHGIGTMIALNVDGKIVAAYVGDVMTKEIFGFRSGSQVVHRISEYGKSERLGIADQRLGDQYVLLRNAPSTYSRNMRALVAQRGGLFKNLEVSGGSIGIAIARLWKGEVGAVVLEPGRATPWDRWPIIGVSQQLGFEFYRFSDPTCRFTPLISTEVVWDDCETLIFHESRLCEFDEWCRGAGVLWDSASYK